jgi:hypothetical protein
MQRKEVCICGHAKESHAPEVVSTGDLEQRRETYWGLCLGLYCECPEYEFSENNPSNR